MGEDDPLAEEKRALRVAMRRRLAGQDAAARRVASEQIVSGILSLPAWHLARRVLLFAPLPAEPDLDLFWHGGQLADKDCVYPAVNQTQLELYVVPTLGGLRQVAPWNLREPAKEPSQRVSLGSVDVMLVPGLAFDGAGGRLGRGGGFYDRLLAQREGSRPLAVGIGFGFQKVDRVPLAAHDVLLDAVVLS